MKPLSSPEKPLLILQRFNGVESYPIQTAEWNFYWDNQNGWMNLWLFLAAGPAVVQQEDTETLNAEPHWELNFIAPNLPDNFLQPGVHLTIPESYDEEH